ncbi:tRNA epoxyqueuosine(34) reductase QueG [Wohlfahrtiimonas chitiniclastica]|uniref:tRNA epoxyqueuosine(34) reductase QueG n=1 Tax=Wohlfahrtiimonas chitiniclastica TaxID=400946 RepID=UPI0009EE0FF8|nr:tRNA epoxyqueuosine(34) reductase QueG [Wohlfahrtiimonas chitiniclastica]
MTCDDPAFIQALKEKAEALGFTHISSQTPKPLTEVKAYYEAWLAKGYHGGMDYLSKHGDLRFNPMALMEHTKSILTIRLPYYHNNDEAMAILKEDQRAYIARYALGRDYHNVIRKRLTQLGQWIAEQFPDEAVTFRAFTDSAPILERELAERSGLGFSGKNTLIIDREKGSYFFLGELFISLPIVIPSTVVDKHCGRCTKCIQKCPTGAIVSPYEVDARRCISYLTIEHFGAIDEELRPMMGNRIFGCDDCQLFCPWNRFANHEIVDDFKPRHSLNDIALLDLLRWSETTFLKKTEGMPIRRIGHARFIRNITVALGNANYDPRIVAALEALESDEAFVREHIDWALKQQHNKKGL